jgi:hypothetical protein
VWLTHFEAVVGLLAGLVGSVSTLAAGVWRLRGFVDTVKELGAAIEALRKSSQSQHEQNQVRLQLIEQRLDRAGH